MDTGPEDGKRLAPVKLSAEDTNIAGRESGSIKVPYRASMPEEKKAGAEYYLNLSVQLKEDTEWAKQGHEVALRAVPDPGRSYKVELTINTNVTVDDSAEDVIKVSGTDFRFEVEKATGTLKNYVYKGETSADKRTGSELLERYSSTTITVTTTETGRECQQNVTASDIAVGTNDAGQKTIRVTLASASQANLKQTMVLYGRRKRCSDRRCNCRRKLEQALDVISVSVLLWNCRKDMENVEWYGNGPVEAMWDREDSRNGWKI